MPTPMPGETPGPTPTPTAVPTPSPTPTTTPGQTAVPPPTGIQEVAIIENYRARHFYPDPVFVIKDVPLRLFVTRLHREHLNQFNIEPFLRSTAFFPPGTTGVEEFTPDETGEFEMHNVGHGGLGEFIVVDTVEEAKRRIAERGIQEFSLIHDLEGALISPSRIVVQKDIPVRIHNVSLKGEERVSIEPFYAPDGINIKEREITTFEFTPDVVGEFAIRYDSRAFQGTLVVE